MRVTFLKRKKTIERQSRVK